MSDFVTGNDNTRIVDIIGYDCGWGCADYGCQDGPEALPADQIMARLQENGCRAQWQGPLGIRHLGRREDFHTKADTLAILEEGLRRLSAATARSVEQHHIPLVFGGDHSSAIGTWSGVIGAQKSHRRFGLVWIDAHMDCHTPETSHQGKWGGWWHGQPIPALQGHGLRQFTQLGGPAAKIAPAHVTIIGAHSFEPAETEFTQQQGIRVFTLDDVRRRGFANVFAEAMARATDGTAGWGLSLDLDAFHPDEAPGVGTDETDGLRSAEVLPVLKNLAGKSGFSGLEIAEFNPHRDQNHKTGALIERLVGNIFTQARPMGHND
jgi:arginase